MPTWTLKIRSASEPQRKPVAWFIPGRQVDDWCEELLGWGSLSDQLQLLIVPQSPSDRSPRGLLAIGRGPESLRVSLRSRPYGCIGQRFYLPVEAQLQPAINEAELEDLLPAAGRIFVFHPAAGLVGFEAEECFRLGQLLRVPEARLADWNHAQPGTHVNERLLSIRPRELPSVEQILQAGGEDIGESAADLFGRPDSPADSVAEADRSEPAATENDPAATHTTDRPSSSGSGWIRNLLKSFAKRARSDKPLAAKSPASATSHGLLARVGGTIGQSLRQIGQWLTTSRTSSQTDTSSQRSDSAGNNVAESARQLLEMLKSNPDCGLKYAPPLDDGSSGRELGHAHSTLRPNEIRFDLNDLGKTEPAGAACVSYEIFMRLKEIYHKLAMREVQLGRHRRAAYILAFLLNDLGAAASVLEQGQHFREAAVLYQRVGQTEAAGLCLEKGSLWSEALLVWEEIGNYERVARVHEQLGQPAEAAKAYRKVIDQRLQTGDHLGAAQLLLDQLREPQEALDVLQQGWQQGIQSVQAGASRQAINCLRQSFRVRDQLQDHEESRRQLAQLQTEYQDSPLSVTVAEISAELAREYSAAEVRTQAADLTRALAAKTLSGPERASDVATKRVLTAVKQLVPQDRLLRRDCDRYFANRPRPTSAPPPRGRSHRIRRLATHQLSRRTLWVGAFADGDTFCALGLLPDNKEHRVAVGRGRWSTGQTKVQWLQGWNVSSASSPVISCYVPGDDPELWLRMPRQGSGPTTRLVTPDGLRELTVSTPSWLPVRTVAMTRDAKGVTWCVEERLDRFVVTAFLDRQLIDSIPLRYLSRHSVPPAIYVRDSTIYVASGDQVEVRQRGGPRPTISVRGAVKSLGSWPAAQDRLFAVTDRGGVLLSASRNRHDFRHEGPFVTRDGIFTRDLDQPVIGAISSQWVVAAAVNGLLVFRTSQDQLVPYGDLTETTETPVAVLETGQRNQFAILTVRGHMHLYEIGPAHRVDPR